MTARRALFTLGLTLTLFASANPAPAQPGTLGNIARDPVRFDHRQVIVSGTVGFVGEVAGRQAFDLIGEGLSIRVLGPPQPTVKTGDRVEVEGTFSFAGNQIDAFRVTWR